jgi:hypothetical protein
VRRHGAPISFGLIRMPPMAQFWFFLFFVCLFSIRYVRRVSPSTFIGSAMGDFIYKAGQKTVSSSCHNGA